MNSIYLWKEGGRVIYHSSLEAAVQLDGLSRSPDRIITEEEFNVAEGLVRLIGGEIVLGQTQREKDAELAQQKKREILLRLETLDRERVRPAAEIVLSADTAAAAYARQKLAGLEDEAALLRKELETIENNRQTSGVAG